MLIKCDINILFQITVVLSATSSTGNNISCVLDICDDSPFQGFMQGNETEKGRKNPRKILVSSSSPV